MLDRPRRLEGGHGHGGTSGLRSTGDGRSLNGRSPNVGTDCDRVHDVGARALSCHVDDAAPRRSGVGRSRLVPSRDVRRRRAHGCRRVHYVRYGRICSGDGATHRRRRRSHSGRARLLPPPPGPPPPGSSPPGWSSPGSSSPGSSSPGSPPAGPGPRFPASPLPASPLPASPLPASPLLGALSPSTEPRRSPVPAPSPERRDHRGGNTGSRGRRVRVAHGRDGG